MIVIYFEISTVQLHASYIVSMEEILIAIPLKQYQISVQMQQTINSPFEGHSLS